MPTQTVTPLEIQKQLIDLVCERQTESRSVGDLEIAEALGQDLTMVRAQLELLASEDRLEVVRDEGEFQVIVNEQQRARHEAPPPHVAARERLENIGDFLESIQETLNRIFAWAPLVLAVGGATVGWFSASPEMRVESAFYIGVFGLLIGCMIRKELIRW